MRKENDIQGVVRTLNIDEEFYSGSWLLILNVTDGNRPLNNSLQDIPYHIPMHIRQPEIPSLKAERQPCVLQAELVENRRL